MQQLFDDLQYKNHLQCYATLKIHFCSELWLQICAATREILRKYLVYIEGMIRIRASQVDAVLWHKKLGESEYRQNINLKKLEWCNIMENFDKFPLLDKSVAWINITFPSLVQKCPFIVNTSIFKLHFLTILQLFRALKVSTRLLNLRKKSESSKVGQISSRRETGR